VRRPYGVVQAVDQRYLPAGCDQETRLPVRWRRLPFQPASFRAQGTGLQRHFRYEVFCGIGVHRIQQHAMLAAPVNHQRLYQTLGSPLAKQTRLIEGWSCSSSPRCGTRSRVMAVSTRLFFTSCNRRHRRSVPTGHSWGCLGVCRTFRWARRGDFGAGQGALSCKMRARFGHSK